MTPDDDSRPTDLSPLLNTMSAPDKRLLPVVVRDDALFIARMAMEPAALATLRGFVDGRALLRHVVQVKAPERTVLQQLWDWTQRRSGLGCNADYWVALLETAAAVGVGYDLTTAKYLQRAKQAESLATIPRCLQTPLDVLGLAVADILLPTAVKVAQCDGQFAASERGAILQHFVSTWGLDAEFLSFKINEIETETENFSYLRLRDSLKSQCQRLHLPYSALASELLHIVEQVIVADGILNRREQREITTLRAVLF